MHDQQTMSRAYAALERLYQRCPVLRHQVAGHSAQERDAFALRVLRDEEVLQVPVLAEKAVTVESKPSRRRTWWWLAGIALALVSCQQVEAVATLSGSHAAPIAPRLTQKGENNA